MTDREKLVEIGGQIYGNRNHMRKIVDANFVSDFADAILAAGFGDVSAYKDLLENAEKYSWRLKGELRELKAIAERAGDVQWLTMQYLIWVHLSPEEQNKVDLGSFISQRILNGEGKDGGG